MATQLNVDPATERAIDELMRVGGYGSPEELLHEAIRLVRRRDGLDDAERVDDDTLAAVERGIADANAGRVRPVADVFRDLRRRYENR